MQDFPLATPYGLPETPDVPQPEGIVQVVSRQFADDRGFFSPLGTTFFPLACPDIPDETIVNEITLTGDVDYLRALGEVGGSSWADRTIDPRRGDYETVLAHRFDITWDLGKRIFFSCFGGGVIGQSAIDMAVNRMLNVLRPRQHMLQCVEIANEDNFPGNDVDLRRVARMITAALPGVPLAPHSGDTNFVPAEEDIARFLDVCNMLSLHLDRTDGDQGWRVARQTWGINNSCAHAQGEPAGIYLKQNEDVHDATRMAFMWGVGILNAFTSFVIHTGAGVRLGGSYDQGMGRPSSFAQMPDYPQWVAKCRQMAVLMPDGVCNWVKTSQRGTDPWPDNFLWADSIWSDGFDHGCSRNYVAYSGQQFICLCFGVKQWVELIAKQTVSGDIYGIHDGSVGPFRIEGGSRLRLGGNANADGAYVLVGTR